MINHVIHIDIIIIIIIIITTTAIITINDWLIGFLNCSFCNASKAAAAPFQSKQSSLDRINI